MICVYKITNPAGKIYVGATIDYKRRVRTYSKVSQLSFQRLIRDSILFYGYTNHIFEVIEECTKENIHEREIYWIKQLNTFNPNGLNLTTGGKGTNGRVCSDYQKKKLSEAKSKEIHQYDLDGNYLMTYESAYDAQEKTGISFCDIRMCICKMRNRKTAGGYFWSETKLDSYKESLKRSSKRRVLKYSTENQLLGEYKNIEEASTQNNVSSANISRVCNGIRLTAGGFIWKFKD